MIGIRLDSLFLGLFHFRSSWGAEWTIFRTTLHIFYFFREPPPHIFIFGFHSAPPEDLKLNSPYSLFKSGCQGDSYTQIWKPYFNLKWVKRQHSSQNKWEAFSELNMNQWTSEESSVISLLHWEQTRWNKSEIDKVVLDKSKCCKNGIFSIGRV